MDPERESQQRPAARETPPDGGPDFAAPSVHRATELLRELLDASDLFREALQGDLTVNTTDLEAMQHLLTTGPVPPTELAHLLGISTTATTTAVDRLVDLGHVTRMPHPTDRRRVLVVPTDTSRRRAFELLLPLLADLEGALAGFSDAEQQAITAYLDRATAIYRAHADRSGEPASGGA